MSIRGVHPYLRRPFSSGLRRHTVDNCFADSPVTANYPQLSSTDEPTTAILHIYYTYFSLVIIYSWRWPFTAAPAHIYGCLGTCLDTYTITNRIHTCTHDQFIVVHTFYSIVDAVQFYLPRICIYCILFSLLVSYFCIHTYFLSGLYWVVMYKFCSLYNQCSFHYSLLQLPSLITWVQCTYTRIVLL